MCSLCFQKSPPCNNFWSDWFGNQSKISFGVDLKPGIARDAIRRMVVELSCPVALSFVRLEVAPPLDKVEVRVVIYQFYEMRVDVFLFFLS